MTLRRPALPFRACLAVALTTLAPVGVGAQEPTPRTALVLEGVTVVDVEAGTLLADQRVVVRGDTIRSVGPAVGPPPPDAAVTVDGRGLYVMPGLVDHHVHLGPGMDDDLERMVRGGVTLVQAMAGDNRTAGELRRKVLAGEVEGPDIAYASVMAGPAFHEDPRFQAAGLGYPAGGAPWMQAVTPTMDDGEIVRAVAAARGSGAEVLKLYAMIDAGLLRRLTDEAHRQGLRVVAHATVFPARPSDVVAAGVDILTHAPYLSWEGAAVVEADDAWDRRAGPYGSLAPDGPEMLSVYREMARRGSRLEPTLQVFQRGEPDSVLVAWAEGATRAASAAGVGILAGTDGMIGPGARDLPNVHAEMARLVAAGLTPAQALRAATLEPARAMGRDATHGRVAPGRVADLVLLSADPLASIDATRSIRWVVRRGRLVEGPASDR